MAKKKNVRPTRQQLGGHIELLFLIACDATSRDPNTGKATLYGIFHAVTSAEFPIRFRPFALFGELRGEGQHPVDLYVVAPTGEARKIGELTIDCSPRSRATLDIQIAGFEFESPGEYVFQLRRGRRILKPTCTIEATESRREPRRKR